MDEIMERMKAFAASLPERESSSLDGIDCLLCGNNGYICKIDDNGYEVAVECECMPQRILHSRMRFLGLPPTFRDLELRTFSLGVYRSQESRAIASTACQVVKYYLDHFEQMRTDGKGLYLYSRCKGSGKTRMVASIANELIRKRDISVKYMTAIAILDEIKNSWNSHEYTERQVLDMLFTVPVLIIDDFGAGKMTEWVNDRFYQIINERYVSRKVTIFTSNMSLSTLTFDDRITNRIKERSFPVDFPEESVREAIAKKDMLEMMEDICNAK